MALGPGVPDPPRGVPAPLRPHRHLLSASRAFDVNFHHFPQHEWSVILVFCGPQGNEPPPAPHLRECEDEWVYFLDGWIGVFVDDKAFTVGESPQLISHLLLYCSWLSLFFCDD